MTESSSMRKQNKLKLEHGSFTCRRESTDTFKWCCRPLKNDSKGPKLQDNMNPQPSASAFSKPILELPERGVSIPGLEYLCMGVCREMEGKYFHFLVPAERPVRTKDSTWKGKLVALEKMIGRAIDETETKAKKDKREFKQEMDGLKEEVKNLIAEQNTKINQQAARHELMLAMILQKLDEGA